jgi:ribonuclease P protein component
VVYIAVSRTSAKDSPVQVGFSVPKKKFRSSVDRHRVRRLMVESWRLSKSSFYPLLPDQMQLHIFFIFTTNVLPAYEEVNSALITAIDKLKVVLPTLSVKEDI